MVFRHGLFAAGRNSPAARLQPPGDRVEIFGFGRREENLFGNGIRVRHRRVGLGIAQLLERWRK